MPEKTDESNKNSLAGGGRGVASGMRSCRRDSGSFALLPLVLELLFASCFVATVGCLAAVGTGSSVVGMAFGHGDTYG